MSTEKFDKQIPLLLRTLENAMRGGYSLVQALEKVAGDVPAPLGDDVKILVDDLRNGKPMQDSLTAWLKRTPSADLGLVIAAFRVQFEVGGNLPDKLNLLGQILDKRDN
jgi:tight adherence protein B